MKYQIPRGTVDILPDAMRGWRWIEDQARKLCHRFCYDEVRTPIFEHTEVFERGVGQTTDIVQKEMYSFADRGGRQLTLRPEGTAGVVRAFVENKCFAVPLTKWFYIGPMFRYERPQAGRSRQFHQFGVEALGSSDVALDAEVIALGMQYFTSLGLRNIKVMVNSLGSLSARMRYKEQLVQYFKSYQSDLSSEERDRLHKNPLRILDSKNPHIQEVIAGAPALLHFLDTEDRRTFDTLLQYLENLHVPYEVNHRLVRGLDYYEQTAFEYIASTPGAQAGSVGGGGRYNGLVQEMGGPEVPAIGFAIGLERVLLALKEEKIEVPSLPTLDCYIVTIGEQAKEYSVPLLHKLRQHGLTAEQDYTDRKVKGQLKAADRMSATFVAILGEEEIRQGKVQIKHLASGKQEEIAIEEIIQYIQKVRQEG